MIITYSWKLLICKYLEILFVQLPNFNSESKLKKFFDLFLSYSSIKFYCSRGKIIIY